MNETTKPQVRIRPRALRLIQTLNGFMSLVLSRMTDSPKKFGAAFRRARSLYPADSCTTKSVLHSSSKSAKSPSTT